MIDRARSLRNSGAHREAAKLLNVISASTPDDINVLKEIANLRHALGDYQGVLEALARVEEVGVLGPHTQKLKEQAIALTVESKVHNLRKIGRIDEAVRVLEAEIFKRRGNIPLLKTLANLKFKIGDYRGVLTVLDQVKQVEQLGKHTAELYEFSLQKVHPTKLQGYDIHYYVDPEFPKRLPVEEMIDKLQKHDLISFDIFDTAIVRAVSKPSHVFRIMGSILNVTDFVKKRTEAESYARTWNDRRRGTREVVLDDIYAVLAERHDDTAGWKELEERLEIQLTRVNPYIFRVFEELKAKGKRLIFTSDMYLPMATLRAMLARAGYTGYEKIYLSNEHAARKGDGTLQAIIVKDYGPELSIAHVGDVFDADVTKSNEAGITGVFNPHQHGLKREYDMGNLAGSFYEAVIDNTMGTGCWNKELHYTHGFRVGGILALGYIEYIERLAREKGADRILFLGRDCYILSQIYTRFFGTLPSEYVDTSRVAALMLTSNHNFGDYISRTFFRLLTESKNSKPIYQLFEDSGFGYLVQHLEREDIEPLQFPASANAERLREFFWSKRDVIEEHLKETKAIAREYFAERIKGASTILAVDIGWTGTCISTLKDYLNEALGESAPKVFGSLLCTSRNDQVTDAVTDGSIGAYIYSPVANQDIARLMMPGGRNISRRTKDMLTHPVEYLFTEATGSTISYARDETGKPVPVRGSNVPTNIDQILDMQRGMVDFVELYLAYSEGLHQLRMIGAYTAFQPLRNSFASRPYQYAVYKDFLYDAVSALHGKDTDFTRYGDLINSEGQRVPDEARTLEEGNATVDDKRRRILFVSPEMKYVGAPKSLLRLCKVAANIGFEPIIWTQNPGNFSREFKAQGFSVQTVLPTTINDSVIEDLKRNHVDLVVCNTVVTDRYVKAFEGKLPIVWYIREATNLPQFLRGNPARADTVARSSNITVVSNYAAKALSDFTGGPVEVVHNAVEDYADLALPYTAKKDGIVRFVQLGTIEHRKGYDVFVAAFKAMPEDYRSRAELHFAGGFINSGTSFASYLFGQTEGELNIHFHGLVTNNRQKIELLSQMDVVVVASRDESCSLVALEGAMLSKPLIVTENVGAKYMVAEDNGRIVASGDVDSLRTAFMEMIDQSESALKNMGEASRRYYDEKASMEIHARDLESLFRSRIAQGPISALPPLSTKIDGTIEITYPEQVIVSLTSFPPRMPTIATCVKSLKLQSYRADRILLWLSLDQFPGREAGLPETLLALVDDQFQIRWVEGDLGPHKKYFYAMQEFPDAVIITVDDDVAYNIELVGALVRGHRDRPNCIIAGRTNLIRFRPDGSFRTYDHWAYDYQHLREAETYSLLPTGIGGVLYPPRALPPQAFDVEGIKTSCPHADDLWLKIMATANGRPVWMPREQFSYETIGGSQSSALWRQNAFHEGNDEALKKIVDYLKLTSGDAQAVIRRIWGLRDDGTMVGPSDELDTTIISFER